ncbi:hypothetical protein GCM10010377_33170 [Streptomyces viridiviolaceus]|nr:hypothetical protein GCM10010377_33170 [Streptomyces viridiviolaceus]
MRPPPAWARWSAEPVTRLQYAFEELEQARRHHDHTERRQAAFADRLEDQHGQAGRRAGHLEAAPAHHARDETAPDITPG